MSDLFLTTVVLAAVTMVAIIAGILYYRLVYKYNARELELKRKEHDVSRSRAKQKPVNSTRFNGKAHNTTNSSTGDLYSTLLTISDDADYDTCTKRSPAVTAKTDLYYSSDSSSDSSSSYSSDSSSSSSYSSSE